MRKLYSVFIAVIITASVFAQAPEKMNYQAVVRNSSNQLVAVQIVGMRISILQGSATGSAVYVETQAPTTNANGLVTVEIGSGTVVSGTFSAIDWSNGTYFIKTETDPTGGTSYSITGTSQLLSVPYALYSKIAVNGISASQASKLEGIADGAEVNVNADWNATSGDTQILNKPTITTVDGTETKVIAGTNVTVTGAGSSTNPYVVSATVGSMPAHHVGELYGGGVVYYVDYTGQHGLICSMVDLSTSQAWSNVDTPVGVGAQSEWNGKGNTMAIIAQEGHTNSAAKLCDDYSNADYGTGVYSDWYLPACEELRLLVYSFQFVQKALDSDGNITTTALTPLVAYCSSSERTDDDGIWGYHGLYRSINWYGKKSSLYVRAVRAF